MKRKNILLATLITMACFAVMAQTDGIVLNSKWTPDIDSYGQKGTLRLEAYATGEQVTTTITKTKACDVVLVLDQSGSMGDALYTYKYTAQASTAYKSSIASGTFYYKSGDTYYEVKSGTYNALTGYNKRNASYTYADISGNTYYYKNGDNYYEVKTGTYTTQGWDNGTSQNWNYNNVNNKGYYYLYNGNYYEVKGISNKKGWGNEYCYIYFDTDNNRFYLTSGGLVQAKDKTNPTYCKGETFLAPEEGNKAKDNNGNNIEPIEGESSKIWNGTLYKPTNTTHYYAYYTKDNTTCYLSGNGTTTTRPSTYLATNTAMYTGDLYTANYETRYVLTYTFGGVTKYYLTNNGTSTDPNNAAYSTTNDGNIWTGVLYKRSSSKNGTKIDALKTAVTTFVNQVQQNAQKEKVDHRIAIVGFASTKSSNSYNNTEILSLSSVVNYANASATNYANALVNANDNGKVNTTLTTAINRLANSGDTYPQYGIDMANKIFAQHNSNKEQEERQRIIVLFTDGYPAPSGSSTFTYSIANGAIDTAYIAKSTYNAKIYAIGVWEDADPNADIFTNFSSTQTTNDAKQAVAANRYMHYISSEYTDAHNITSTYTKTANNYYMTATSSSELEAIFQKIAVQDVTGGATNESLTQTTTSKGVLSDYFKLPGDVSANDIKIRIAPCNGYDNTTQKLTFGDDAEPSTINLSILPEIKGKSISVSGFNFSEYWCGTETVNGLSPQQKDTKYHGYELVMEIPVEIDDAGLQVLWKDGNHEALIPINTKESGLYNEFGNKLADYDVHMSEATSPLPIELLSFTAECMDNAIQFNWSTATETNNEYFTLERSEDAVNYTEIARIQGAGTSATQRDYSFMANNNSSSMVYYRLRQTDINGTTEVFEPIAVQCSATETASISMYPVPAKDMVTIESNQNISKVEIFSMQGRLVKNIVCNHTQVNIDLNNLNNGMLLVRITTADGESMVKKLIKQ